MATYKKTVPKIMFSGPTYFAEFLNQMFNTIRKEMTSNFSYNIILILTDGAINDMENTINAIVDGSNLPVSIIIVGVGNFNFTAMKILDADNQRLKKRDGTEAIRDIVTYLDVSDGKLEEGSLRCDVNVSIRPYGNKSLNTKVEIKNLNSFSNIKKAIDYEISRQSEELLLGRTIKSETRRYDEIEKKTILMREKETQIDYKFFQEPNIITDDYNIECWLKDNPDFLNENVNKEEAEGAKVSKKIGKSSDENTKKKLVSKKSTKEETKIIPEEKKEKGAV